MKVYFITVFNVFRLIKICCSFFLFSNKKLNVEYISSSGQHFTSGCRTVFHTLLLSEQ